MKVTFIVIILPGLHIQTSVSKYDPKDLDHLKRTMYSSKETQCKIPTAWHHLKPASSLKISSFYHSAGWEGLKQNHNFHYRIYKRTLLWPTLSHFRNYFPVVSYTVYLEPSDELHECVPHQTISYQYISPKTYLSKYSSQVQPISKL